MPSRLNLRMIAVRLLLLLAVAAIAVPPVVLTGTAQAVAQERRTLFDLLFGAKRKAKPERPEPRQKSRPRARTVRRSAPQTVQPTAPAKDKLENARIVLVVGDFIGGGLAQGLEAAYTESPGVRVVDRSNGSSGLVRDDYYDWPGNIGAILDEEKPQIVVVMLGSNDRQQMIVDGSRERPRTDAWNKQYEERATTLAKAVRDKGLPLIWVGMPSFKSSSMTTDMLAFNDIYKVVSEREGGEFVDIWEGFVNENGAYVSSGPDINGQTVQLRAGDGINITSAGKRKIAFYAEKPLKRLLGDAVAPGLEQLEPGGIPQVPVTPEGVANIERTAPISFADPELDGGAELLGHATEETPDEIETAAEKLAVEGIAPPAQEGRADDFMLDGRPTAKKPATDETTTAIGR